MIAAEQLLNEPIKNTASNMTAYQDIYEQYIDEASFLWVLRSIAVEQPHYFKQDIEELENRIEAQLNGLMTSIEAAWQSCIKALEIEEPGEVFTATMIAFRSHEVDKIQLAVETGLINEHTLKGLVSSLGWLPDRLVNPWIKKFLTSKDFNHKYLALCVCSIRREDPGEFLNRILQREDCRQHEKLYARCLRLIGELRRQDLMEYLNIAAETEEPELLFWSNWSAVLLGNRTAVDNLRPFVFDNNIHQMNAVNLAFRVLPVAQSREWVSMLSKDENQIRTVIKATGVLGDPHAVNWLIVKMRETEYARIAAEAFTMITGIDITEHQAITGMSAELNQQPNDDPEDTYVEMDEDENLPMPDAEKVAALWRSKGHQFITGQRYFMGQKITPELLNQKIIYGNQRQRHAAALELALSDSMPLKNTRARIS